MPRKSARPRTAATQPDLKFRGGWAPADLFHLIRAGTISPLEFVLLLQIDALVESGGPGCYASNRYFGEILRVDPRHVRRTISRLGKLGLVLISTKNRMRFLETSWSRIKEARWTVSARTGGEDIYVLPPGHLCPPIKDRSRNKKQNSPSAAPPPSGVSGEGAVFEQLQPPEPNKLHLALALRLREWTVKNKETLSIPVRWNPTTWANDMRILADSVGLEVASRRLDYLLTNNPSAATPGLPTPVNAKVFRSAAVQTWIMNHIEKSGAVAKGAVANSPAEEQMVADVMKLDWAMSKLDRIRPTVVEAARESARTMNGYAKWARAQTVKKHDLFREKVVKELSGWDGPRQSALIVHWFRHVASVVGDWDRWQGDLRKLALHHSQKMFGDYWTEKMGLPASELPKFREEVSGGR